MLHNGAPVHHNEVEAILLKKIQNCNFWVERNSVPCFFSHDQSVDPTAIDCLSRLLLSRYFFLFDWMNVWSLFFTRQCYKWIIIKAPPESNRVTFHVLCWVIESHEIVEQTWWRAARHNSDVTLSFFPACFDMLEIFVAERVFCNPCSLSGTETVSRRNNLCPLFRF